jgi:hypothetical protein
MIIRGRADEFCYAARRRTNITAMSDIVYQPALHRAFGRLAQLSLGLSGAIGRLSPSLLFALRLWVSVCLALYVAFWLELDKPFWAGASAAIVCQPQLGASLRKGWFRLIGILVGAVFIVVLTGFFPQDHLAYLGLLAMWGGLCAFGATVLRKLRLLCGSARRVHRRDHCCGHSRSDRRGESGRVLGGGLPCQRNQHRDCLRRYRSCWKRSRWCPAAA